jgi:hypothetical protein
MKLTHHAEYILRLTPTPSVSFIQRRLRVNPRTAEAILEMIQDIKQKIDPILC